jgi:hypothetical protein
MKARWLLAVICLGLVPCTGCHIFFQSPVRPWPGLLFNHTRAPLTTQFDATLVKSPKNGTAHTTFFAVPFFGRWDFAFSDATFARAIKDGKITKVHYADYEYLQVLGVFARYKTIVYGE